jgi:hypothetical protein
MGPDKIVFSASGLKLQYGSDGDFVRDDGARVDHNYPLTCEFEAPSDRPLELRVKNLQVNNAHFTNETGMRSDQTRKHRIRQLIDFSASCLSRKGSSS